MGKSNLGFMALMIQRKTKISNKMNLIEIKGTLCWELSKKVDKNGYDYYYGQLDCNDGTKYAFFFFGPDYDLSRRLVDLQANKELTLQGFWSKREPVAFIARNFYLEEEKEENNFSFEYGL